MLTSVIEEKNSRIMEMLLSAVTPFQLMAGKILGLAGIGLTVIGLWSVAAYGTSFWQGLDINITGILLEVYEDGVIIDSMFTKNYVPKKSIAYAKVKKSDKNTMK